MNTGWTPITVMILLAACTGGVETVARSAADLVVTRDSAGITIVENLVPEPASAEQWVVDTVPSLTIGVEMGDSAYEFTDVRGVTRLPNGMIVVLNGEGESAFEFRFFDENGKHIATHGRRGPGPGEFRWVNFLGGTGGDTIVAVDFPARRISWLSAHDGFLRSIQSDESLLRSIVGERSSGLTESMAVLGDSLYAIKSFHSLDDDRVGGRANEFHIVDLAGRSAVRLGRLEEPRRTQVQLASRTMSVPPIGQTLPMHVVDRKRQRICAGVGHVAEINCVDASGKRLSIRWVYGTIPITAEDRSERDAALVKTLSRMQGGTPGDIDRYRAAMVWPANHPPYNVLQMDADGNFWISERTVDSSGRPALRFRIFNPEGILIAFANHFRILPVGLMDDMEIGSASVLRAITSADGVPRVGVFPIRKSAAR